MNKVDLIRRGQIYEVELSGEGSVQGGIRPVVIISNNVGNKYSPVIICSPLTSRFSKRELPTHVVINDFEGAGLNRLSQVLAEQIFTVDKKQLRTYIGSIDNTTMGEIDKAIEISVQVGPNKTNSESREMKAIKTRVEDIKDLDKFIEMWVSFNKDMSLIEDQIEERSLKIADLERLTKNMGLNYRDYYSPVSTNKNNRLVG